MRGLGYIFGILLLVDAIPSIFNPQFWVQYTERNLTGYLPESVTRTVTDFGRLSDDAIRTKALTQVIVGMMLIFLASMVPTRYLGLKGGRPSHVPHTSGHPTVHAHEHAHQGEERPEHRESL